ncbi:hypothetical protein [Nocardia sp. NPDC004750]
MFRPLYRAVAVFRGQAGDRRVVIGVVAAQERVEFGQPGLADLCHPAVQIAAAASGQDRDVTDDEPTRSVISGQAQTSSSR